MLRLPQNQDSESGHSHGSDESLGSSQRSIQDSESDHARTSDQESGSGQQPTPDSDSEIWWEHESPPFVEPGGLNYEALSYAWGSDKLESKVYVKHLDRIPSVSRTRAIPITRNLDIALRYLRYETTSRLMWIDALCINQDDKEEKSHLVPLMGRVFKLALRVVVWLGPESDDSSLAIRICGELANRVVVDWERVVMTPADPIKDIDWADRSKPLRFTKQEALSLYHLCRRPWFERTWIRQEIKSATTAILRCGHGEINWAAFETAGFCLTFKGWSDLPEDLFEAWVFRLDIIEPLLGDNSKIVFIYSLRQEFGHTQCTDPRDMIYAVLSLMDEADRKKDIKPDYSKPTREVYLEVVEHMLDYKRTTEFLVSCELASMRLDLPSWVPDWSLPLKPKNYGHDYSSACAWISSQTERPNPNVLRCSGVQVDIVAHQHTFDRGTTIGALTSIRQPPEIFNAKYVGSGNMKVLEAYCRTLCLNAFADSYAPPDLDYPGFPSSQQLLRRLWTMEGDELTGEGAGEIPLDLNEDTYLRYCSDRMIGRSFISTNEGYIGLAPADTRLGDVVCVLLGCPQPVVLRPLAADDSSRDRWQVVGVCYVQGLMSGEAIYGNLPSRYRPVWFHRDEDFIDGTQSALHDMETGTYKTNPAEILEEMNIPPVRYRRYPYLLEVPPQTLRDAGVNLVDFDLV